MSCHDEKVDRENANWRICIAGIGAELVRKVVLERLQPRLGSFCAHGSLADLVALDAALELAEKVEWSSNRAVVIESLLALLRAEPGH